MNIETPAAALVATGVCTAACLLALDDECECRCAGRFHAALAATPVPIGPRQPVVTAPATERTIVADVLAILDDASAERMHSDALCVQLAARWPEDYQGWTPVTLARALLAVGIRTRQIWQRVPDGTGINRSGVHRADLPRRKAG